MNAPIVTPKLAEAPLKPAKVMDAKTYAEDIRSRRGDVHTMESRLGLNATPPEGWEWRWCNDVGDNITLKLADGWRFVSRESIGMSESIGRSNDAVGDRVEKVSTLGGDPIKVVLMEIPKELAEEYREIRSLSKVRAFEETINRGGAVGISGTNVYTQGSAPGSLSAGVQNTLGRAAA